MISRREHKAQMVKRMNAVESMLKKHSLDPTPCEIHDWGFAFLLGTEHIQTDEVMIKIWELWDEVRGVTVQRTKEGHRKFYIEFKEEEMV